MNPQQYQSREIAVLMRLLSMSMDQFKEFNPHSAHHIHISARKGLSFPQTE